MHNYSNCIYYIIFKTKSVFEDYIMKLNNVARTKLYKFRCRNHNLPVTNNRFDDGNAFDTLLYRESRQIGDEFQNIFNCRALDKSIYLYINQLSTLAKLYNDG